MRANLSPTVKLDFIDGYLFRLLQEIAAEKGYEASGFLGYYQARVDGRMGGLLEYEEKLAVHLLSAFKNRKLVHAGIGIGTLACALASNGMHVLGIESFPERVVSARRIRDCLVQTWPEVASRYEIVEGRYPDVLAGSDWIGRNTILVFTNVGAGWNEDALDAIIKSFPNFGEVFLDLRLFGSMRAQEEERQSLYERIATSARWAERLPHVSGDIYLARFVYS